MSCTISQNVASRLESQLSHNDEIEFMVVGKELSSYNETLASK